MTGFHVLIPARMASERLPGKPLLDVSGKPLVVRVLERARQSDAAGVHVATDDGAIARAVSAAGGGAVLTGRDHASGTSRLAEAAAHLNLEPDAVVVNLQGDEPAMPPACLAQVAGLLDTHPGAAMATLWMPLTGEAEWRDPNVVKLVAGRDGRALYFSRAPIPHRRSGAGPGETARRHVGLYAYRVRALRQWPTLPASELEQAESLEQLRALDAGWDIVCARACDPVPPGVDTAEDLEAMRAYFAGIG